MLTQLESIWRNLVARLITLCLFVTWLAACDLQDNGELKGQVRAAEKLRAEAEQALAAAEKAHGEEAARLRRIGKKTAEDLEEAQLQLKALRERLDTLELSEQQALRELAAATTQLDALQSKGVRADSAMSENAELKQVRAGLPGWVWVDWRRGRGFLLVEVSSSSPFRRTATAALSWPSWV